ncbi:MAG: LysR family transcriptional regulator [Pseudomonadota bacterium]
MDDPLDWTLLQTVLAVAEGGSLSAAARRLGLTQPTVGRQVRAAEAAIGRPLFTRHPRGLTPTDAALALIGPAREMAEAAARAALALGGGAAGPGGTVRITASLFVSHHILPPILARIGAAHPGIEIELHPSDSTENLLFREADIALRMYEPAQGDVITRRVADLRLGLYAARSYLAGRPPPESVEDFRAHRLIGYDRATLIIEGMARFGLKTARGDFALRCDDQAAYWQLLVAGGGIGASQCVVGEREPRVARILPALDLGALPVWLTAHAALRTAPHIRAVWDALAEALRALDRDPANA